MMFDCFARKKSIMRFWNFFHCTVILLLVVNLSAALNPDEAAIKTIEAFCGNTSAVETLESCANQFLIHRILIPKTYGDEIKKCSKTRIWKSMEKAMEYACDHKVEVGQCVVASIPHESDKCIHVDLTTQQIRDFNEEIKKANS